MGRGAGALVVLGEGEGQDSPVFLPGVLGFWFLIYGGRPFYWYNGGLLISLSYATKQVTFYYEHCETRIYSHIIEKGIGVSSPR